MGARSVTCIWFSIFQVVHSEKCRKSRSSVFLCSETKRKRLLRRLIRTKQLCIVLLMLTESLCIQTWKVPSKFLIIPFTGPLLPPKKYIRDVGYSVRRNLTKELCGMFYLNTPFDWQLLTRFLYEGKPKPWWFLLPCKKPNPMISSFRITYGNRQTSDLFWRFRK